jgi:hypothetical protein
MRRGHRRGEEVEGCEYGGMGGLAVADELVKCNCNLLVAWTYGTCVL